MASCTKGSRKTREEGFADYQVVGEVMAHQAYDD
jgi:hypothetical protein